MQILKTLIVAVWLLLVLVPIAVGLGEDNRWMLLIPMLLAGWVYWFWRSSRAGGLLGANAGLHLSSKPVITSPDREHWDEVFRASDEMAERSSEQLAQVSWSTAAGDMTSDDYSSARSDVMDR